MQLIHDIAHWYISMADTIGWELFCFLGMLIESSFVPFPSEIIMPPAGHQAGSVARLVGLIIMGTMGSLGGALINYFLGWKLGRPFFEKYGRYVLISQKSLDKMDRFWATHGEGSTFIARWVPAVRQLISIPAGISRMHLGRFCLYTALGSGSWVTVLALVGWAFRSMSLQDFIDWAENSMKSQMLPWVGTALALMIGIYLLKIFWWDRRRKAEGPGDAA